MIVPSARRGSDGLGSASFAFSGPHLSGRLDRYRVNGGGGGGRALDRFGENFALGIQPMDVSLALGLTIGDPEVVGAFANCLFQIWHGILLANRAPGPAKSCPVRLMNS